MTGSTLDRPFRIAIACGGTGGHLFPGLAVGQLLAQSGCRVTLLISPKEVDQQAVRAARDMEIVTLPAVGLTQGRKVAFVRGFIRSYLSAKARFSSRPPEAVLAMGGFTSAPPLLAAKRLGSRAFLHESNTIPGRANRWLSWVVDSAFTGFPGAAPRLHCRNVTVTGTPVRSEFMTLDAAQCRAALGLDPVRPVVLVMGGSQGAHRINTLVQATLPKLAGRVADWQWFHLAGQNDAESTRLAFLKAGVRAMVHPFFAPMELALGAATVAISRAGASSLAEMAAMAVPAILVPFPAATDNHQFYNALALQATGAACLMEEKNSAPETLGPLLIDLMEDAKRRQEMQAALAQWHRPRAARQIAEEILRGVESAFGNAARKPAAASA